MTSEGLGITESILNTSQNISFNESKSQQSIDTTQTPDISEIEQTSSQLISSGTDLITQSNVDLTLLATAEHESAKPIQEQSSILSVSLSGIVAKVTNISRISVISPSPLSTTSSNTLNTSPLQPTPPKATIGPTRTTDGELWTTTYATSISTLNKDGVTENNNAAKPSTTTNG